MTDTYTAYFSNIAFAAGKNMAALLNADATELIKVRRVGLLNSQVNAVTGVICQLDLQLRTSATLTGSTPFTPTPHDSTNAAAANLICASAGTPGGSVNTLRRVFWSSDEPAISSATLDEMECMVPFNIIWDAGYADSSIQPLTLRQNQMIMVYNQTGAAGLVDIWMEYTRE